MAAIYNWIMENASTLAVVLLVIALLATQMSLGKTYFQRFVACCVIFTVGTLVTVLFG